MRYTCSLILVMAVGCGDDGEGSSPGRGSAACQDWQDAICDFASGECGVIDRPACDDNYTAISCNSDDRASDCANAFNQATCAAPPASCDLSDLADPAPAQQACTELLSRLCARAVACGMSASAVTCTEEAGAQIDCSLAIGYTLGYDDCLDAVDALSCTAVVLPDVCDDVLKLQQT
jgi:hypothetical protein